MGLIKKKDKRTNLEREIDELLVSMSEVEHEDEKYKQMAEQLVRLYTAKELDTRGKKTLSPDAVLGVCANLAGLIAVLGFEQIKVISMKGLSWLSRFRV